MNIDGSEFKKLKQTLTDAQQLVKQRGQSALWDVCQDFLNAHPEVDAIQWVQHHPWCDGDTSYFAVSHTFLKFTKEIYDQLCVDSDEEPNYKDYIETDNGDLTEWAHDEIDCGGKYESAFDDFKKLLKNCFKDEISLSILETIFGSGCRITIKRDIDFEQTHYLE